MCVWVGVRVCLGGGAASHDQGQMEFTLCVGLAFWGKSVGGGVSSGTEAASGSFAPPLSSLVTLAE